MKRKKDLPDPRQTGCYAARRACGCCVGTAYDLQDKETGATVAQWITDGLTVNHVTWSEFQAIGREATYCNCPHK